MVQRCTLHDHAPRNCTTIQILNKSIEKISKLLSWVSQSAPRKSNDNHHHIATPQLGIQDPPPPKTNDNSHLRNMCSTKPPSQHIHPPEQNHPQSKTQIPQIALHAHQIRTDDTMQHLQPLPRRITSNPLYRLPHLAHMRLAFAGVEYDTSPWIIEEILQSPTRIRTFEDSLKVSHVNPVSRVSALIRSPSGEGTPIVVFGYFCAEEKMAFADHLPDDVDDFEPAFPGGEFDVGCL